MTVQRSLQTGDPAQDQRERARRRDVESALRSPLLEARQVRVAEAPNSAAGEVTFEAGDVATLDLETAKDNIIPHRLGKAVTGWLVTEQRADATVWRVDSADEERYLTLRCSANCTVGLAVW